MLHELALQLYIAAKFNPAMLDAIFPKGPKYSPGARKVMAAQIIKSITGIVKDANLKNDLLRFAASLYAEGAKTMRFDQDDYCPHPFYWRWPWPWPPHHIGDTQSELNSQPSAYASGVLHLLASSMDEKELVTKIEGFAVGVGRQ